MTRVEQPLLLQSESGIRNSRNLAAPAPKSGDVCPRCREARLEYDGLLNLSCPRCGYAVGGCFT